MARRRRTEKHDLMVKLHALFEQQVESYRAEHDATIQRLKLQLERETERLRKCYTVLHDTFGSVLNGHVEAPNLVASIVGDSASARPVRARGATRTAAQKPVRARVDWGTLAQQCVDVIPTISQQTEWFRTKHVCEALRHDGVAGGAYISQTVATVLSRMIDGLEATQLRDPRDGRTVKMYRVVGALAVRPRRAAVGRKPTDAKLTARRSRKDDIAFAQRARMVIQQCVAGAAGGMRVSQIRECLAAAGFDVSTRDRNWLSATLHSMVAKYQQLVRDGGLYRCPTPAAAVRCP